MSDRLRGTILSALSGLTLRLDDSAVNLSELAERLAEKLGKAGVTLPPEPEIPVPEEAVNAYMNAPTASCAASLRAAYPHIVAAVIDGLPDRAGFDYLKVIGPMDYYTRADYLHTALRSSKAGL